MHKVQDKERMVLLKAHEEERGRAGTQVEAEGIICGTKASPTEMRSKKQVRP